MYGLYRELLKQGFVFFLPTTTVQSHPFHLLYQMSPICFCFIGQAISKFQMNSVFFPCKFFTIGAYMPHVKSTPTYSIRHCFTHTHQALTYIHTEWHAHTQLLQPSKPNYSLPPASLCQLVMSATERQWDSWLGTSGWPHWCRGGKRRQEVKRRLALERFAK